MQNATSTDPRDDESGSPGGRIESHEGTIDNEEPVMNPYRPRTPRTIFGLAAVALTAGTFALAVAAPAGMACSTEQIGVLTQSSDITPVASAAREATASIDIVAVRGTRLVPVVQWRARDSRPALQG